MRPLCTLLKNCSVPRRWWRRRCGNSGRRGSKRFVAQAVGAPADVYILVIGKEVFVEQADLIQDAFAVKGRAPAGRKDAAGLCVTAGFHAVAPLAGKAQKGDVVARVVGQGALKVAGASGRPPQKCGIGAAAASRFSSQAGRQRRRC